jgi:hypothetical protein
MSWKIIERKIGRAGNASQQMKRQYAWTQKYGDNWAVGYMIAGEFVLQEDAWESIYYKSYEAHFSQHPEDLQELINTAKILQNPHAIATGGTDLQVPAIMAYLNRNGLHLAGKEVVDIGTYENRSHAISVRLSPLTIKVVGEERMTLEQFWQERKCLAVWEDEE